MSYISDYLHGGSEEEYRAEAIRENMRDRAEREEAQFYSSSVENNYELFEKRANGEWYYVETYDIGDTKGFDALINSVWEYGKKGIEVFASPEEE